MLNPRKEQLFYKYKTVFTYFSEERIREMSCADGYQLMYDYKENGFGAKAVCGNSTLTYNYDFATKVCRI